MTLYEFVVEGVRLTPVAGGRRGEDLEGAQADLDVPHHLQTGQVHHLQPAGGAAEVDAHVEQVAGGVDGDPHPPRPVLAEAGWPDGGPIGDEGDALAPGRVHHGHALGGGDVDPLPRPQRGPQGAAPTSTSASTPAAGSTNET